MTDDDIVNDATITTQVVTHGLGTKGQRYSPLDQVNTETVKNLVPVWSFSFGGEKQRGQQSQPLIHDGKMYVTASYSRIFALDATTGQKLWKYEHRLLDGIMPCCDVINRGAALYDDLVIFGTLDAQLVALNKDTGKVVWRQKIEDYKAGYSFEPPRRRSSRAWSSPATRRRVRHRRPRRCARREDRQADLEPPDRRRPHGLHLRCRRQARWTTASPAPPTPPGPATCGRPAARRPGRPPTTTPTST